MTELIVKGELEQVRPDAELAALLMDDAERRLQSGQRRARPACCRSDQGAPTMWAQLIKMRVRPDKLDELPGLFGQLQAAEQPDSGLLRTTAMQDQKDPSVVYVLVVFENEQKAREREQDPRRSEMLQAAQATMAEVFEGSPEFVDLTVVQDAVR